MDKLELASINITLTKLQDILRKLQMFIKHHIKVFRF